MAVWVVDCLAKRMFLEGSVLAFGWMRIWMEAREAGSLNEIWVP